MQLKSVSGENFMYILAQKFWIIDHAFFVKKIKKQIIYAKMSKDSYLR